MIVLSYTTLNSLILEPHTWLCKQMGLKTFSNIYMLEGKKAHRIIQAHVSGKQKSLLLNNLNGAYFPIVEEEEFDKRLEFYYEINDKYAIHGYMDGKDKPNPTKGLEIKTSSKPWGLMQFYRLPQWKMAALAQPSLKEMWFITATRDLSRVEKPYMIPVTEKHKQEGLEFVKKGISIIESGDFDYKGVGKSRYCFYENCPFCGK